IRQYIKKTGMLSGHERVICGVSGGADSVYLFAVMRELTEEYDLKLRVVHVHHGIRGAEADRDAAYVEEMCGKAGVPVRIYRRNIPAEAAAKGISLEEAGRDARREIYALEAEEFRKDGGAYAGRVVIALAHHRDDLAESVIFRLARGTGIKGLAAIRPISPLSKELPELRIIRPLLMIPRAAIEEALKDAGMAWCEDSTNDEDDAARNRIRHTILPALAREVNSGAAAHIAASALMAAEAADFIQAEAKKRYTAYVSERGRSLYVSRRLAETELPAMQSEVLRMCIEETAGTRRDVGRVHVTDLMELFGRERGKEIHLPGGITAVKEAEGLRICRADDPAGGADDVENIPPEGIPVIPGAAVKCGNMSISAAFEASVPVKPEEKRYTKTISYDKIKDTLVLRTRRAGDFITVRGDGARKSLGNYFTDQKVPRELRDRIPLIADGSEVVWVIGMRLGYTYRTDSSTERALTISADIEND
ncbi:MAG: tRNA lysidine(34) synthetase TilS, partial [Lachnospiraceae bacterium]|nr:tRNA lysidine(34) synthetase TilS [Lachnospiraceae bacterium]